MDIEIDMKKYSKKILDIVGSHGNRSLSGRTEFKELIIFETSFLPMDSVIADRIWYIKNNIHEHVVCPVCQIIKSRPIRSDVNDMSIKTCGINCTLAQVGPDGLSVQERSTLKRKKSMNNIGDDGLSVQERSTLKRKKSMYIIGPDGLSPENRRVEAFRQTVLDVDVDGDTIAKRIGRKSGNTRIGEIGYLSAIKAHETIRNNGGYHDKIEAFRRTVLEVDADGDTIAKRIGRNVKAKFSVVGEDGYTQYQRNGLNHGITVKRAHYNNILRSDPRFTMITTEDEYVTSSTPFKIRYMCNKCEHIIESYWRSMRCTTCYPYNMSIGENEVLEFCQSLINNTESNNRQIIGPLELDIYLPDHNLAIEYNGIFWHSSYSTESENKSYHLNKTELCHEKNVQLFHIFENEWHDPITQNIWKSIIGNRLGKSSRIYARKTTVRSVTAKDKTEFLDANHLQGNCMSSVNLGLYMDGELVSVMTFGRSRYDKKVEWELIRFCNRLGYSVVGGAGKLLKAFRRENDGSIISYADKRRSVGNLYEKLGFELSHESCPNYFYFKTGSMRLESRVRYQKHKLAGLLDVYDSELTESENMYNNGYRKIYDCGNQVWILD